MFRSCIGLFLLSGIMVSCARKYSIPEAVYEFPAASAVPDYSELHYWAAHPWKKDPSDSIPEPLRSDKPDSLADVFFIHPTTYTGHMSDWNADINDPDLNRKTDYSSILYQSSAFNSRCRVFAPRYRQGHLSAFFTDTSQAGPVFDTAYADIKKAFEFFLDRFNKGRPLIIAGHSQGGMMAIRLLQDFFDGKENTNLVVAYIIGWPIAQGSFKNLPVCTDSVQTGCFCGWRTYRRNYLPPHVQKEESASFVTNPLSWTTGPDYASRQQNQGSVLWKFNKVVRSTTDAQLHNGVLWVNKPRFPGSLFFNRKNYHIGDINLFYVNLRENVDTRIRAFIKK